MNNETLARANDVMRAIKSFEKNLNTLKSFQESYSRLCSIVERHKDNHCEIAFRHGAAFCEVVITNDFMTIALDQTIEHLTKTLELLKKDFETL